MIFTIIQNLPVLSEHLKLQLPVLRGRDVSRPYPGRYGSGFITTISYAAGVISKISWIT